MVEEFEGGIHAHGFEGLCVRATLSEATEEMPSEKMLTLFGASDKGKVLRETVRLRFCREVEAHVRKPRPLFNFARLSFERKLSMLGRYGITDVSYSAPFEKVDAKKFKPEGCHIQLWLILLEQAFPRLVTYSPELLHTLFAERVAPEDEQEIARRKVLIIIFIILLSLVLLYFYYYYYHYH